MKTTLKSSVARHPKWTLVLFALVSWVVLLKASELEGHYEMEDFFPRGSAERQELESLWEDFGRDDRAAVLVIEKASQLELEDFQLIEEVTESLVKNPMLEKVVSPTNTSIVVTSELEGPHFEEAFEGKKHDQSRVHDVLEVFSKPPYINSLISSDKKIALITALLKPDFVSSKDRLALREILRGLGERIERAGYQVRIVGYPMHRLSIVDSIGNDAKNLYPIVLAVIGLVLLATLQTLLGVVAPLIIASVAVAWAMGIMAWLKIALNFFGPAFFLLVIIVSVTDAVHLLTRFDEISRRDGLTKAQSAVLGCEEMLVPCLLTSLTTGIVFAALGLTTIPLIADFGFAVGVGCVSTFWVTFLLFPPIYVLLGRESRVESKRSGLVGTKAFDYLGNFLERRYRLVIGVSLAVLLISLILMTTIKVNSPLLADLSPEHESRKNNVFLQERLGGIVPLDVLIAPPSTLSKAAAYSTQRVAKIRELTRQLRELSGVLDVTSPVDLLDHFRPILDDLGQQEANGLLPTALLLADDEMEPWVASGKDTLRIRLRIDDLDTKESMALFSKIREKYEEIMGESSVGCLSGQGYLSQRINHQIVEYFGESFWAGLILVFLLLLAGLRNFSLAFVSLFPNILPLVVVGGVMGALGIEMRYTTALVLTVAFGIAVDDTIHFLAHYAAGRKDAMPVRSALKRAGPGIALSSLVLGTGFLVLLGSDFLPNQTFGGFIALTALVAVFADLFFLPACLIWSRER